MSILNKKVRALLFADGIWFFGEGMLGPLFAVFAQRVGGDVLDITWAWSVYLIVYGVMTMLIGKLSDNKIKKEWLVAGGFTLNALLTFGYLFVQTSLGLLVLQFGLGIAAAMATPTWDALYAKYGGAKNRGYLWGLSDGMDPLVTGIAIIIGGLVVNYISFTALFLIMGVIQLISAATIMQIFTPDKS
jgi:MFS family permease